MEGDRRRLISQVCLFFLPREGGGDMNLEMKSEIRSRLSPREVVTRRSIA